MRHPKPGATAPDPSAEPPFLATKIALPRVAARWIERPRLLERLGVPPRARVTLLHAGPGFGKTVCLVQWQKQLALAGTRVAWYTAEPDDGDAATFIGYLAAALNAADGAIGADVMELSRGGPAPRSASLVARLLNQVAASRDRYVLVIDDYHCVQSPDIDELASQLVAHAPANLDLVIAARGLPNLRLGKLRADGQVVELGPETLGLTRAETGIFAEGALGQALPARDVAQLQSLSDGWPAVLQMMLVALGGKKHLHSLVRGFTGEARVLREYLAQEAFDGLPESTQRFLLRSSVLARFCAPLCEHVTGCADGAAAIAEIEQRQLLIVALDAQGHWFRYHPLFADFLLGLLRAREPAAERELLRRASEWFERESLWGEAVRTALAAGDDARALDMVDGRAMALVEHGEFVTLLDWIARFPPDDVARRARLRSAQAWALGLTMRRQEAQAVIATLARSDDPELDAEMRLLEDGMAILADDFHADAGLVGPTEEGAGAWMRDVHKTLASYVLSMRREYRRARALPTCETPLKIAYQKMLVGLAWWREGDGDEAERAWTDALEYADAEFGAHSVTAALVRALAARSAYERGDWRSAQEALDQRLAVIEQSAPLEWLWSAYATLAAALAAGGQRQQAVALLQRGADVARQRGWWRLEAAMSVDRLRLDVASDVGERLDQLAATADAGTAVGAEIRFLCELGRGYALARTRIGDEGVERMAAAIERYGPDGAAALRAQAALMLSEGLLDAGRRDAALTELEVSLAIGERLRLGQMYRDAGGEIGSLLASIRDRKGPGVAYAQSLLGQAPVAVPPARVETERVLGALSDREREVLMLVGRGMSNKEIGRSLRIGPETVKWHLKNLFAKLGVPNRIQAVNRARGLSMIA